MGGDAQAAAGIAGEVLGFACPVTGLEPEGAIDPESPDACDLGSSIRIDRHQPTCVTVGTTRLGCLCDALVQPGFYTVPVQRRGPMDVIEVRGFHDGIDAMEGRDSSVGGRASDGTGETGELRPTAPERDV